MVTTTATAPSQSPPATNANSDQPPKKQISPFRKEDATRRRSRSRSPDRNRLRSPPRKAKGYSGLKWKNDDRPRDRSDRRDNDDRPREYRDRRDYRDNDRRRDDGHRDDRRGEDRRRDHRHRDDRRRDDRHRDDRRKDDRHRSDRRPRSDPKDKDRKPPAAATSAIPGERKIEIKINNRLGAKTTVECFPSNTVLDLKRLVAGKIGQPVHSIMLKRQGEGPLHDFQTLADKEIHHLAQLDLELNTGD